MKLLVNEMPKKKEECLFYRKKTTRYNGLFMEIFNDSCSLNDKECSFKNGESIFGGECRCIKVGSDRK